jgi:beta-lactamase superfamily II metal-dependent hydrolase
MKRIENFIALTIVIIFTLVGAYLVEEGDPPKNSPTKDLEIHFLDVGQGDSILFEQKNEQVLIDGGPDETVLMELGRVLPVDDRTIETIVITHPHADHLGGLIYVLQSYDVGKIYYNGVSSTTPEYLQLMDAISQKRIPIERLFAGKSFWSQKVYFSTLWPNEEIITNEVNDTSLIIEASYYNSRVLLTGDASAGVQRRILESLREVSILKVSHHGSNTGTDKDILAVLTPKYAVITVGKNSYGHPTSTVLAYLAGSIVRRTDRDGTVSFWADQSGVFLY